MTWFSAALTMGVSVLSLSVIVELIARAKHPHRLFFMALGRARNETDDARATRLRLANAVLTAIALTLIAVDPTGSPAIIAVLVIPLVITGWLLFEVAGAVKSVELERIPGRYRVAIGDTPTVKDLISVPLQVVNVLCLIVPSAVFAWILTQLPSEVPLHWDAAGNVNRTGSPVELWMMAGTVAFDLVLLWGIVYGMAKERWALPEKDAERYAELQFERRRLMVRFVEWIMTAVNGSIALIWLIIPLAWFEPTKELMTPLIVVSVVLMTLGTIAPIAVYLPRLMKVQDGLRAIAGTEALGTRPSGWRLGGTVYYAPEDPAVLVPKRIGIGQTLNFARPASWIIMAVILGMPIAITIIAFVVAE